MPLHIYYMEIIFLELYIAMASDTHTPVIPLFILYYIHTDLSLAHMSLKGRE